MVPDPLKIHKAAVSIQGWAFIGMPFKLDHHPFASETSFEWRFACGPMMARISGIWIISPLINQKNKTNKKNPSKLDPLWQNFLDLRMRPRWKAAQCGILSGSAKTCTLANSEDADEMPLNEAFYQGLQKIMYFSKQWRPRWNAA